MKVKVSAQVDGKKYTFHRTKFVRLWNKFHPENSFESEDCLQNPEVYTWLESYLEDEKSPLANESRRSYLNALKQIIRNTAPENIGARLDQKIRLLSKKIFEIENDNRINPVEDKNWMPWEEILEILQGLEDNTKTEEESVKLSMGKRKQNKDTGPLPVKRYQTWQQRLLLSMYVYQPAPLRHNYSCVLFLPDIDPAEDPFVKTNYIYEHRNTGEWWLHLGKDKVIDSHGPVDILVDSKIRLIIETMLGLFGPRKYLLTHSRKLDFPLEATESQPVKNNTIRLLASIPHPKKDWSHSNICLFTLRSSKATHFLSDPNRSENEIAVFAKQMRTSVMMLRSYYKKITTVTNK